MPIEYSSTRPHLSAFFPPAESTAGRSDEEESVEDVASLDDRPQLEDVSDGSSSDSGTIVLRTGEASRLRRRGAIARETKERGRERERAYVLFCGRPLSEEECRALDWAEEDHSAWTPSVLPMLPDPSTPSGAPRKARSTGCGAIVHMAAYPRPSKGVWSSSSSSSSSSSHQQATDAVVPHPAHTQRSPCGCRRETVACCNCGNMLGQRYRPCETSALSLFSSSPSAANASPPCTRTYRYFRQTSYRESRSQAQAQPRPQIPTDRAHSPTSAGTEAQIRASLNLEGGGSPSPLRWAQAENESTQTHEEADPVARAERFICTFDASAVSSSPAYTFPVPSTTLADRSRQYTSSVPASFPEELVAGFGAERERREARREATLMPSAVRVPPPAQADAPALSFERDFGQWFGPGREPMSEEAVGRRLDRELVASPAPVAQGAEDGRDAQGGEDSMALALADGLNGPRRVLGDAWPAGRYEDEEEEEEEKRDSLDVDVESGSYGDGYPERFTSALPLPPSTSTSSSRRDSNSYPGQGRGRARARRDVLSGR